MGVCIATSGPGAMNLITAIATAYMDSIPLVIITGQVKTTQIGKDVFQEADVIGAIESFTKYNYLVKCEKDIPKIMKEAFYIARTGRPVLIDIPVDIQLKNIGFSYPEKVNIRGYKPRFEGHLGQIKKSVERMKESKKPLICIGGSIISAGAEKELKEFVEKSRIPVVHTLMGKGGINADNPYYVGLIGSHGFSYANKAISNSDLLIFIGTRVADRSISDSSFPKDEYIIHIDIDPAEIGKILDCDIPIVGDSRKVLEELIKEIEAVECGQWFEEILAWKHEGEKTFNLKEMINPKYVLKKLSNIAEEDAIMTVDVGQNQLWCARNFDIKGSRSFFASEGLGTMGYSLPAAIGAQIANPDRRVIAVMGDGSFQMSMFELGTIVANNVNIIILLFNNSGLGLVREIQKNTNIGNFGVELNYNSDFVKLAEVYGLRGKRVICNEEFEGAYREAVESKSTFLIECVVDPQESTL